MQLHFKKYGEHKPVLFILHGLFGMSDNWHNMAKKLSEYFTVYTLDLRNHGQSPHSDEMNYDLMAQDVHELVQQESIHKLVLIGHSMGGKVAMTFALNYPNLLSQLIVVDISPRKYKPSHQIYFDAMRSIDFKAESRKAIEQQLETLIKSKAELLFILKNLYRKDNGEFGLKINFESIETNYQHITDPIDFSKYVSKLEVPTLFIKGQNSRYISKRDEEEIPEHFTHVKFEEIENAGHWVHADNPEDFFKVVIDFTIGLD